MDSFVVLILGLVSICGGVFCCSICPDAKYLRYCTCADNKISCTDNEYGFDLRADFKAIVKGHNWGDQFFESLEIKSKTLEKLEAGVFQGVTFRELNFNNVEKLSCVDPGAFRGLEKTTTRFIASYADFSEITPNCNIFSALNSMRSLERIEITGSKIKEIPDNAFSETQNNLKWINLKGSQGGQIKTIGKNAFSALRNLNHLDLSYNKIYKIDINAFEFFEYGDNELYINLEHNRGLNGGSFAAPMFALDNRRTTLNLGANTDLQYLNENVFRTYLSSRQDGYNKIELGGSPLCYCTQNQWLLGDDEPRLRLIDKIHDAKTNDGDVFWKYLGKQLTLTPRPVTTPKYYFEKDY